MYFDFQTFSRIAAKVQREEIETRRMQYGHAIAYYSLNDALSVFHAYFDEYEKRMGRPHPPIRATQIASIMRKMPWIGDDTYIEPESYRVLIWKHFQTRYRNCDYNINHFFSGRIRELRFYEELY